MQLAMTVFVSDDLDGARQLVEEKLTVRQMQQDTQDRHLIRLREKTPGSIGSSNMHLEIARALKEVNSIYVAFAYPTLARYGVLLDSRVSDESAS